jgi:hypothetical protein
LRQRHPIYLKRIFDNKSFASVSWRQSVSHRTRSSRKRVYNWRRRLSRKFVVRVSFHSVVS